MMFVIIATNNTHSTTISVDILQGSIILNLLKFWHSLVIFATKATHCKVCTNRFNSFGTFKKHILCNHVSNLGVIPKGKF